MAIQNANLFRFAQYKNDETNYKARKKKDIFEITTQKYVGYIHLQADW